MLPICLNSWLDSHHFSNAQSIEYNLRSLTFWLLNAVFNLRAKGQISKPNVTLVSGWKNRLDWPIHLRLLYRQIHPFPQPTTNLKYDIKWTPANKRRLHGESIRSLLKERNQNKMSVFKVQRGVVYRHQIQLPELLTHITRIHFHHSMSQPQVADGEESFQVWRVAAKYTE